MKKILFVMQSLYNGGAERSLVNLLNELPKDQFDISVLLFKQEGMFLKQIPENVHILETPEALKKLYSPMKKAGKYAVLKLYGTLKSSQAEKKAPERAAYRWQKYYSPKIPMLDEEFDIVVAYISGEVMYYVAEKVRGKMKYVWIHNDYRAAGHPKNYDYKYLQNMNGIISISEKCVDILKEEFPTLKDKVYYIPNLTSSNIVKKQSEAFYPSEFKNEKCIILSIGRLQKQKGFDMAIEAASKLKKDGIQFKWFVIGTGELEESLKLDAKKKNVLDCFCFLGARENPYPYIKNCTIFVQPSRWEGKSVVLDEAKILCKPIIATNYPTVNDQIEDGKEGMVVNMNSESIAEGIKKLVEDKNFRRSFSEYLKTHEYGNQTEVKKYIRLFCSEN